MNDNLKDINIVDVSGNPLETYSWQIKVEHNMLMEGARVSNSLNNPFISVVNPELITAQSKYYINIDSILGIPGDNVDPGDPDYNYKLINRVFVSLHNQEGALLCSDEDMIKCTDGITGGYKGHFALYPPPEESGVPFNVEFDLGYWSSEMMVFNAMEVQSGVTPVEDVTIPVGYNEGNNSSLVGYRAADFEIRWMDTGDDSLSLQIMDLTHNVPVNYTMLPGSGWNFHSSWSKLGRLGMLRREDITEADYSSTGVSDKAWKYPKRSGSDVKMNIYLCGMQIRISTPEETVPQDGDIWLLRSNYGQMPADSTGYLTQSDEDGNPLLRPPVAGLRYELTVNPDNNDPNNVAMDEIKVVPNPYLVSDQWDRSPQEKRIAFTNLPTKCSIRIYTLSGNLVQVLAHEGAGRDVRPLLEGRNRVLESQEPL